MVEGEFQNKGGTNTQEADKKPTQAKCRAKNPSRKEVKCMKRLNIAYGSNLNLEQMSYRCLTAKVYGKGMLRDYRLLFKGSTENAYLTIEPYKGGRVPVVIWELQPEDEKALDFYEGYPNFYYKENVEVELENGEKVIAMIYIMTDKIKDRIHINLPSRRYLNVVKEGYQAAGFDSKFIDEALDISEKAIEENPPSFL